MGSIPLCLCLSATCKHVFFGVGWLISAEWLMAAWWSRNGSSVLQLSMEPVGWAAGVPAHHTVLGCPELLMHILHPILYCTAMHPASHAPCIPPCSLAQQASPVLLLTLTELLAVSSAVSTLLSMDEHCKMKALCIIIIFFFCFKYSPYHLKQSLLPAFDIFLSAPQSDFYWPEE